MDVSDMSNIWPPGITAEDAPALEQLAAAGIGEGDFDGDHVVPPHLVELYEAIEWQAAVGLGRGR